MQEVWYCHRSRNYSRGRLINMFLTVKLVYYVKLKHVQNVWIFCTSSEKIFSHLIWELSLYGSRKKNSSGNNYSVKQISLAAQPIKSTTQIWVVTCHQYGIFALVSQTSFRDETSDGVKKCRLISQGIIFLRDSWASEIREGAPLENEGLLIVSHLFLNGETNRACSRWSDSGLWREVSERKKKGGGEGEGERRECSLPTPPLGVFPVHISLISCTVPQSERLWQG